MSCCRKFGLILGVVGFWSSVALAQSPQEPPSPRAEVDDPPAPAGGAPLSGPAQTAGPTGDISAGPETEKNGLMVLFRSEQEVSGAVSVTLKGSDDTVVITVNDAGEPPDVSAGDGIWAGVAESAPLSGRVSVESPLGLREGGAVEWAVDASPRELQLTWTEDALEVRAAVHQGTAQIAPVETDPPTVNPATVPPSVSSATAGVEPPPFAGGEPLASVGPVPPSARSGRGGVIAALIALLVSLISLVVALRVRKSSQSTEARLPLPPQMSEAGILGAGTPAWSSGVSVWTGPERLLQPLLAHLAHGRCVVVASSGTTPLPAVRGGPVFSVPSVEPAAVAAAVQAVRQHGGLAVGVVVVAAKVVDMADASALARALPPGVGAVVWGRSADSGCPVVALSPAPGGAGVSVNGAPIRSVRSTVRGFEWD